MATVQIKGTLKFGDASNFTSAVIGGVDILSTLSIASNQYTLSFDDTLVSLPAECVISGRDENNGVVIERRQTIKKSDTVIASGNAPFRFVGLQSGDVINSTTYALEWESTDGNTTRKWDVLARLASHGAFSTTGHDAANVFYNSAGLNTTATTAGQPVTWPTNGESVYIRLIASPDNGVWTGDNNEPITAGRYLDILVTAPQVTTGQSGTYIVSPADGSTLDSGELFVVFAHGAGVPAGRQSDIHLSTTPQPTTDAEAKARDLGDSTGLGAGTSYDFTVPQAGAIIYGRIYFSDENWADAGTLIADGKYVDFQYTQNTVAGGTGISLAGLSMLQVPTADIAEGSWDTTTWANTLPANSSLVFANLTQNVSTTVINGQRYINLRADPITSGSAGSNRPEMGIDIPDDSDTYRMVYDMNLEADFHYGITLNSRTAKLGPGFVSVAEITGGNQATNGFSSRLAFRSDNTLPVDEAWLAMYSYYVGRNNPYGDDLFLLNSDGSRHIIQRGEDYRIGTEIKMNSAAGNADGYLKVWIELNGLTWLALDEQNIEWWGSGVPKVERILWQFFHGGDSPLWRPAKSNNIRFKSFGWAAGAFA